VRLDHDRFIPQWSSDRALRIVRVERQTHPVRVLAKTSHLPRGLAVLADRSHASPRPHLGAITLVSDDERRSGASATKAREPRTRAMKG
jgi:hypothetical protein